MLVNIHQSKLTEQQEYAIDLLVGRTPTGESMSKQAIADEVGVSRQTIYDWLKKDKFRQALVAQAKTVTDSGANC
ncbi:phBC6A51 family helix-turn-helix protein [Enterococcus olivae]